jgi:hypothetical protein
MAGSFEKESKLDMEERMNKLLIRIGITVLGTAITLAWWTYTGSHAKVESKNRIPAKVWDGGAGLLTVETESTSAAQMRISFGEADRLDGKRLDTYEEIPAGAHSWTIDVPPRVGGYVELGAVKPNVGDRLAWKIRVNERVVDEQSDTLKEPLQKGYAFFIQSYFEDYSKGTFQQDD